MPRAATRELAQDACPACGAPIGPTAVRPIVAKPFDECGRCGGFVPRPSANEWSLHRPGVRLDFLVRIAVRASTAGTAIALAVLAGSLAAGRGWQPLGALIGFLVGALPVVLWKGGWLRARIRRSRRRMGDPMYLAKLAEFEWQNVRRDAGRSGASETLVPHAPGSRSATSADAPPQGETAGQTSPPSAARTTPTPRSS